jgi:hypothetical protein
MRKVIFFIICLTIIIQSCTSQSSPGKEVYNKDFNWTIKIPENFDPVSAEQWAKMQNKGADAVEKTYDEKVDNNTCI